MIGNDIHIHMETIKKIMYRGSLNYTELLLDIETGRPAKCSANLNIPERPIVTSLRISEKQLS